MICFFSVTSKLSKTFNEFFIAVRTITDVIFPNYLRSPQFLVGFLKFSMTFFLFVFCLSSCNDNAIRDMSLVLTNTVSLYHLLRFLYKTVWLDDSILENELSFLFIAPISWYVYQLVCLERRYYYKEVIIIHTYSFYGKHSTWNGNNNVVRYVFSLSQSRPKQCPIRMFSSIDFICISWWFASFLSLSNQIVYF